jgi:hypothetical protein
VNKLVTNKLTLALAAASFPFLSSSFLSADDALPSVQAVIDHFIAATGGKAAWEGRRGQIEHATIDFSKQGLKGSLTIYESAPDKYLGVTELPGIGKISAGSNGEVAWESSILQGPRVKQGVERAEALREGAFNAPLYWQKLYSKGENAGAETVEGHDCYKIVLTPEQGNPMTEYFDKTSGLMIKTAAKVTSQMGEVGAEILYEDYRKDGDLLTPHRMVNRAAQQEFVVQIESIDVNPQFPKDRFDLPPEVQALVNKTPSTPPPAESKPANQAAATAPSDGGKLSIYMGGMPVATETYIVKKTDAGYDIDGSGNANFAGIKIDIQRFHVETNAKYEPLEADAKGSMGTIQRNVTTTFAGGQAKNEIDSGQGPETKSIAVHPDTVVVNAPLPLYPWTLLVMRARLDTQDPQQFPVYVLGQAEVNATVTFKGREHVDFDGKSAELNHLTVSGTSPQGQAINIDFWVNDSRKLIKLGVPAQLVEAYQDGFAPKPVTAASAKQP